MPTADSIPTPDLYRLVGIESVGILDATPSPTEEVDLEYDERLQRVVYSYDSYPILRYLKVAGNLICI